MAAVNIEELTLAAIVLFAFAVRVAARRSRKAFMISTIVSIYYVRLHQEHYLRCGKKWDLWIGVQTLVTQA
jgi:hypothetical protein